jgi:acetylornithine/succinyldiaminopimelate/putrescine aminotransferase
MGVQKMQLLMMRTIFLGGLKDEIRYWARESGTENVKAALKLAREVEVIPGDAAK